jgi:hypothetical protein
MGWPSRSWFQDLTGLADDRLPTARAGAKDAGAAF